MLPPAVGKKVIAPPRWARPVPNVQYSTAPSLQRCRCGHCSAAPPCPLFDSADGYGVRRRKRSRRQRRDRRRTTRLPHHMPALRVCHLPHIHRRAHYTLASEQTHVTPAPHRTTRQRRTTGQLASGYLHGVERFRINAHAADIHLASTLPNSRLLYGASGHPSEARVGTPVDGLVPCRVGLRQRRRCANDPMYTSLKSAF